MTTTSTEIEGIQQRVLRQTYSVQAALVANEINLGNTSVPAYISTVVAQAASRTKPALVVCNFVEGAVPTSARVTSLALFAQNQWDYGVSIGVDPKVACYAALGVAFSSTPEFAAKVSGKTLDQLIGDTYLTALGTIPSTAQTAHFTSQYNYYYGLYVGAGVPTATAVMQAKGAMVGQILSYGTTTSTKADNWLFAAGNGLETYSTPL